MAFLANVSGSEIKGATRGRGETSLSDHAAVTFFFPSTGLAKKDSSYAVVFVVPRGRSGLRMRAKGNSGRSGRSRAGIAYQQWKRTPESRSARGHRSARASRHHGLAGRLGERRPAWHPTPARHGRALGHL